MMTEPEQRQLQLRVTELEMQLMHIERTMGQLNEVMIEQQQWITRLEKAHRQTRRQLGLLAEAFEEQDDAAE